MTQVNIKSKIRSKIDADLASGEVERTVYDAAQDEIFMLMERDNFSRFKEGDLFKELLTAVDGYSGLETETQEEFRRKGLKSLTTGARTASFDTAVEETRSALRDAEGRDK